MQSKEFYLVSPFVDGKWQKDEVVQGSPFQRIRQLLGGGWEHSKGLLKDDMAMAATRGDRRVMVLRFPDGVDRERAANLGVQHHFGADDDLSLPDAPLGRDLAVVLRERLDEYVQLCPQVFGQG